IGRHLTHGESDWAVYNNVRYGVPNTPMQSTPDLSETQRWQVISFVRFIDVDDHSVVAESVDPHLAAIDVPYEELRAAQEPGNDWLAYSGSYWSTRHSSLAQIKASNVDRLGLRWLRQFPNHPEIEATPLVRDGVMYISVPPCSVYALNAMSGRELWRWTCQ